MSSGVPRTRYSLGTMTTGAIDSERRRTAVAGRLGRAWPSLTAIAIAAALVWALIPIALLAYHALGHGGVISGSTGPLAGADQLFYMDQIRQSAEHVLITDRFDLALGHAVYLNPLYLIGGLIWLLGLPLQAAFWTLSLLAAPLLAFAVVTLAVRALLSPRQRAAAVTLGLFYMSPLVPLLGWTGAVGPVASYQLLLPGGESMPAWQLWGYPHSGVAVGLLALALIGSASIARGNHSGRLVAGVSAAACLSAWLHPWQGATLAALLLILMLEGRSRRLVASLGIPLAATAAPLTYEYILEHTDRAWRIDSAQNSVVHVPWWALLAALGPIVAAALPGIRALSPGPLRTVLIAWPLVALAIYFGTSEFPYHALEGIAIPLGVLAAAGWPRICDAVRKRARALTSLGRTRIALAGTVVAAALIAIATIPGAAYEVKNFHDAERSGAAPYFLTPDDHDALSYLDHLKTAGGVLARDYIGMAVPAFTGRRTWVGEWTWTPDFAYRTAVAEDLMRGRFGPAQTQLLVARIGARFVLSDCGTAAPLAQLLGPLVVSTRRFGCAAVYQVRATTASSSRASAALNRASVNPAAVVRPPSTSASRSAGSAARRRNAASSPATSSGSN